jgi:recombination protein RecA
MPKAKSKTALENLRGFVWGSQEERVFIPTGHAELDYRISKGEAEASNSENPIFGIPLGSVCMIYGGPGGGKSSLAYRICGNAQQMGYTPVWIDVENSYSPQLARINGCDPDRVGRVKMFDDDNPEDVFYAEAILDKVKEAIKLGADIVVIDSIAALVTKSELEASAEKDHMAPLARVLGKTMPAINSLAAAHDALVVCINQLRTKPGVMFGNPEGYKGGNTLPHQSSVILKVNKLNSKDSLVFIEREDGEDELIAGSANVWIEKSRFSMPHKEGIRIPIYYKPYFPDLEERVFNFGREVKVINKRKTVYSWGDIKVDGREAFIEALGEIDLTDLIDELKKAAIEKQVPVPAEILNYDSHKKIMEQSGNDDDDDDQPKKSSSKLKSKPKITKKADDKAAEEQAAASGGEVSFVPEGDDNPDL